MCLLIIFPIAHVSIWKPGYQKDWRDIESHRKFFDSIALEKKFDPLIPENWYNMDNKEVKKKVILIYMAVLRSIWFDLAC